MKKRKIKLFASVASLAMVAAVMGVGVWAATSQAVTVNSTVGFQATSIAANVKLAITGSTEGETNIVKTAIANEVDYAVETAQAKQIANFAYDADSTTTSITALHVALQDGDGDGFINANGTITYSFVITAAYWDAAANEGAGAYVNSPVNVNYAVSFDDSVEVSDLFETPEISSETGTINAGANTTVTITYTLINKQAVIDASTALGKIKIDLTAANS